MLGNSIKRTSDLTSFSKCYFSSTYHHLKRCQLMFHVCRVSGYIKHVYYVLYI